MPQNSALAELHALPNHRSKHKTTASQIYDLHWENLRLVERWDWDRYARFASFLCHTPYELGSLVMLSHDAVDSFHRFNRLRGTKARPTALILTLLESHLLAAWKKDLIENPFPRLQEIKSAE